MNLNYEGIKDSLFALVILAIFIYLFKINSCEKLVVSPNDDYESEREMYELTIQNASCLIDSLLLEITEIRSKKEIVQERIKIRKIYITEKSDTVRKLIKDSTVLAYVDTLELQVSDQDSVIKIQVAEILKLDEVVLRKDTIILNKDLIQSMTEKELTTAQEDNKKKDRKIKILKIERVLYPAIAIIGGIYLSLKP